MQLKEAKLPVLSTFFDGALHETFSAPIIADQAGLGAVAAFEPLICLALTGFRGGAGIHLELCTAIFSLPGCQSVRDGGVLIWASCGNVCLCSCELGLEMVNRDRRPLPEGHTSTTPRSHKVPGRVRLTTVTTSITAVQDVHRLHACIAHRLSPGSIAHQYLNLNEGNKATCRRPYQKYVWPCFDPSFVLSFGIQIFFSASQLSMISSSSLSELSGSNELHRSAVVYLVPADLAAFCT